MPETIPVKESILPMVAELEVHVPPLVPQVIVSDVPTHIEDSPAIEAGDGLTVTILIEKHPVAVAVYVTVVVPDEIPVTVPLDTWTLAIVVSAELHMPDPPTTEVSTVMAPVHTVAVPVIAGGTLNTAIALTAIQVVPIAYVMLTEPTDTPVTIPLAGSTLAFVTSLLLQLPPEIALERLIV